MKIKQKRYCRKCKNKLNKRGFSKSGKQRWFCKNCKSYQTNKLVSKSNTQTLNMFVDWLLGRKIESDFSMSRRNFIRKTKWCWNISPTISKDNQIYDCIIVDGIHIGNMTCLIARSPEYVIDYAWCIRESSLSWGLLFSKIPAPNVVVCDGQNGILKALKIYWTNTKVQRCLFHVYMNQRIKLTLNPQTNAGCNLLILARKLKQITTKNEAFKWIKYLNKWHELYGEFIKERTYFENNAGKTWWYTHDRVRSAYKQLEKLYKQDMLFTFLEHKNIPKTSNYLEGGINSPIRTLLKLHRGLPQTHQMRLVEWYLQYRSKDKKKPSFFINNTVSFEEKILKDIKNINAKNMLKNDEV